MDILIDFDGTCVPHNFPSTEGDIGAVPVLKTLVANGHRLILFTMRSDRFENGETGDPEIVDQTGAFLTDAVKWFETNGIELYGIQTNPTQHKWTTSPKAYGHLIIDDTALGIPLKYDRNVSEKPYVCWESVTKLLIARNLI